MLNQHFLVSLTSVVPVNKKKKKKGKIPLSYVPGRSWRTVMICYPDSKGVGSLTGL